MKSETPLDIEKASSRAPDASEKPADSPTDSLPHPIRIHEPPRERNSSPGGPWDPAPVQYATLAAIILEKIQEVKLPVQEERLAVFYVRDSLLRLRDFSDAALAKIRKSLGNYQKGSENNFYRSRSILERKGIIIFNQITKRVFLNGWLRWTSNPVRKRQPRMPKAFVDARQSDAFQSPEVSHEIIARAGFDALLLEYSVSDTLSPPKIEPTAKKDDLNGSEFGFAGMWCRPVHNPLQKNPVLQAFLLEEPTSEIGPVVAKCKECDADVEAARDDGPDFSRAESTICIGCYLNVEKRRDSKFDGATSERGGKGGSVPVPLKEEVPVRVQQQQRAERGCCETSTSTEVAFFDLPKMVEIRDKFPTMFAAMVADHKSWSSDPTLRTVVFENVLGTCAHNMKTKGVAAHHPPGLLRSIIAKVMQDLAR